MRAQDSPTEVACDKVSHASRSTSPKTRRGPQRSAMAAQSPTPRMSALARLTTHLAATYARCGLAYKSPPK
ncbi:hypothetical protein SPRG_17646, partial [Saprolegnia parasitica CBS 223.65]